MTSILWAGRVALAGVFVSGLALASPNPGPMTVVASTVPEFKPGDLLQPGDVVTVPGGSMLHLFTQSGREIKLSGPFSGVPGGEGEVLPASKLQILAQILFGPTEFAVNYGMPGTAAPIDGSGRLTMEVAGAAGLLGGGTWCIAEAQDVKLSLPDGAAPTTAVLVSVADGRTAEMVWPEGAREAPWPAALPPVDGAGYRLTFADATGEVFILRILPETDNGAARIAQMGAAGCAAQVQTAIAALDAALAPSP